MKKILPLMIVSLFLLSCGGKVERTIPIETKEFIKDEIVYAAGCYTNWNANVDYSAVVVEKPFLKFEKGEILYLTVVDTLGGLFPWGVSKKKRGHPLFIHSSNYRKCRVLTNYRCLP